MPTAEQLRANMVESQLRTNRVTSERVINAFRAVPRENFVSPERRAFAYVDEDLPVAPGRFLMEPMVLGRLLQESAPKPGEKVLLVGAGTGYVAALLSLMGTTVVALESNPELVAIARERLAELGVANVTFVEGELTAGNAAGAPYDLVFIDGAVEEIPAAIIDQVKDGGRVAMVLVAAGVGKGVIGRRSGKGFGVFDFMDAAVPVLPGFTKPKTFVF
ncbi:protein-L-isoaspartate O-methyltransferase family protein [Pedomonas mirosovicensis]|uniref:protein-L-isoaspartate O-methyltransferase family protein n=1 Tax=Pedomonas mirosovicensis TaxID=2908641 RepID=UPI002169C3B4|nr:protein-L-isoaspartate O-methyltransferase [Pedomonas mirosovicensis]MCH8685172.1 protein-L-isoaspartate O-methyltransferase [Pedomonas mirosovicensis]